MSAGTSKLMPMEEGRYARRAAAGSGVVASSRPLASLDFVQSFGTGFFGFLAVVRVDGNEKAGEIPARGRLRQHFIRVCQGQQSGPTRSRRKASINCLRTSTGVMWYFPSRDISNCFTRIGSAFPRRLRIFLGLLLSLRVISCVLE